MTQNLTPLTHLREKSAKSQEILRKSPAYKLFWKRSFIAKAVYGRPPVAIIQFCIENILQVFAFHADGLRALSRVPAPTDGVKNFKAKKAIDFLFSILGIIGQSANIAFST